MHHWYLRPRHGIACQSRSRLGRRFRVLVKDLLFALLQFGDLARYLCLAGRELVDGARYLLLSGGGPVDALPHGVEVESDSLEPLLIGRGSLGCRAGRIRRAIRNRGETRLLSQFRT